MHIYVYGTFNMANIESFTSQTLVYCPEQELSKHTIPISFEGMATPTKVMGMVVVLAQNMSIAQQL